jgi:hypothetical protein
MKITATSILLHVETVIIMLAMCEYQTQDRIQRMPDHGLSDTECRIMPYSPDTDNKESTKTIPIQETPCLADSSEA